MSAQVISDLETCVAALLTFFNANSLPIFLLVLVLIFFSIVYHKTVKSPRKKKKAKNSTNAAPPFKSQKADRIKPSWNISYEEQTRCDKLLERREALQEHESNEHQNAWVASYNPSACKVYVFDTIYVIEGSRKCFRCQTATPVIAFGLEKYFELGKTCDSYHHDTVRVVKNVWPLPPKIERYLREHYGYYERFDKDVGSTNHCIHCHCKQGDHYLFDDFYDQTTGDGIFFDLEMSGSALVYYPIKLPHVVSLYCEFNDKYDAESFIPNEEQTIAGRFSWD